MPGNQFPAPAWTPASDEKGAGGAGGAGAVQILCTGRVHLSGNGEITANGGDGASGENITAFDHVGGGSGGAGGGHVVIQAQVLDFGGAKADAIQALGGRAGAGAFDLFNTLNAGGDGGPGLIQVHAESLFLPGVTTLNSRTAPDAIELLPFFGAQSRARSQWIPLGDAGHESMLPLSDIVNFTFAGINSATGRVLDVDMDGVVDDVAPILGPATVQPAPGVPFIAPDGRTLVVDATPLLNTFDDIYLRNTALLRDFALVLTEVGNVTSSARFDVAAASFDAALTQLSLTVSSADPPLTDFNPPGGVEYTLLPRFFRVRTGGVLDALPTSASISFSFEGATAGADGLPFESPVLVPPTSKISDLNTPALRFFRFEVLFHVDVQGAGLSASTPLPELLFQRTPFRF